MKLRPSFRGAIAAAVVALTLAGCGDCWGDAPKKPSSASPAKASASIADTPSTPSTSSTPSTPSTGPGLASPAAASAAAAAATPPVNSPAPKERPMVTLAKVGDPVPTVRVRDQNGRERSLDEFRGKRVVLWWFPKADTPGWTIEGCGFRDLQAEYTKKNVVLLGASFDAPAENLAFAQKQNYAFDLLSDTDRTLAQALGLAPDAKATYAKRWTYVIGPDGTIEQIIEKVDPRNHPAELLKTLP